MHRATVRFATWRQYFEGAPVISVTTAERSAFRRALEYHHEWMDSLGVNSTAEERASSQRKDGVCLYRC